MWSASRFRWRTNESLLRRSGRSSYLRSVQLPDSLIPVLTPHGALRVEREPSEFPLDETVADRLGAAFARGGGRGLLQLGLAEAGTQLPSELAFWRGFAMQFIAAVCASPEAAADEAPWAREPTSAELTRWIDEAPPMRGSEYLDAEPLIGLWRSLQEAIEAERSESGLPFGAFLAARDSRWRALGRVHKFRRSRWASLPAAYNSARWRQSMKT